MKVIKESLREATNPSDNIKLRHKLYNVVMETIDNVFDNFALTLSDKVPEYDPSWCAEGQSASEIRKDKLQDSFAIAITDMLLDGLDKE